MVFKSDRQRKGFFASRSNVRSNINVNIIETPKLSRFQRLRAITVLKEINKTGISDNQKNINNRIINKLRTKQVLTTNELRSVSRTAQQTERGGIKFNVPLVITFNRTRETTRRIIDSRLKR